MAKIDPYLRPLYGALYDMVDPEGASVARAGHGRGRPARTMRGRTLNNSFIILDEAQNTTPEQMKMFLTRIGFGSKVVVTGDDTQVDVQDGRSGLKGAERVLTGIDQLAFVQLSAADVVRHQIVADIVAAYERDSNPELPGRRPAPANALSPTDDVGARQYQRGCDDRRQRRADRRRHRRRPLGRPGGAVLQAEGRTGELTLTFVDRDEIAALNIEHMGKDGPTDVLSFPLDSIDDSTAAMPGPVLLGDVAVCPAVACESAPTHAGIARRRALLVVHGILHVSATTTPSRGRERAMRKRRCSSSTIEAGRHRAFAGAGVVTGSEMRAAADDRADADRVDGARRRRDRAQPRRV